MPKPKRARQPVRCPRTKRIPGDVVGCGSTNVSYSTEEHLYDCHNCGIWFTPKARGRKS